MDVLTPGEEFSLYRLGKDCSTGNPVVWCEKYPTYGGDPHSWPTSGGTDILAFFKGLI